MKRIGFVILFVCFVLAAVAVSIRFRAKPPSEFSPAYAGVITIGITTWPGYLGFYVARDNGYFKEAGLNVEFKRYDSQAECSKDYVQGLLQGRANLTSEAIIESLKGLDHKVVLAIDYSNGSDGIIANSGIRDFSQVRGKRVAYEFGTLEEYFIRYALNENGLALSDILPLNLDPMDSAQAVVDGRADAAVTFEPFLSAALKKSDGNLIYSSADAPGAITDIFTLHRDFIDDHPETVEAIVLAYFKAIRFWKEHPDEVNAIGAKEFGITKEAVAEQLRGITILDERDNDTTFTFSAGLQSIYGNMRQVGGFILEQADRHESALDTDQLIDKRFIKAVFLDKIKR